MKGMTIKSQLLLDLEEFRKWRAKTNPDNFTEDEVKKVFENAKND